MLSLSLRLKKPSIDRIFLMIRMISEEKLSCPPKRTDVLPNPLSHQKRDQPFIVKRNYKPYKFCLSLLNLMMNSFTQFYIVSSGCLNTAHSIVFIANHMQTMGYLRSGGVAGLLVLVVNSSVGVGTRYEV